MARGKMIMKFIKKLFQKKKGKKLEEKQESWYNNSHEKLERGLGEIPTDLGSLAGENTIYIPTSKH